MWCGGEGEVRGEREMGERGGPPRSRGRGSRGRAGASGIGFCLLLLLSPPPSHPARTHLLHARRHRRPAGPVVGALLLRQALPLLGVLLGVDGQGGDAADGGTGGCCLRRERERRKEKNREPPIGEVRGAETSTHLSVGECKNTPGTRWCGVFGRWAPQGVGARAFTRLAAVAGLAPRIPRTRTVRKGGWAPPRSGGGGRNACLSLHSRVVSLLHMGQRQARREAGRPPPGGAP